MLYIRSTVIRELLSNYFLIFHLPFARHPAPSTDIVSRRLLFCRNTHGNYTSSPLSSRHGSQESLRHLSSMSSMNMLQTPTGNRDIAGAQKKKGIKSSLGRFFSKKEKVNSTEFSSCSVDQHSLLTGEGCERFYARRF